MARLWRSPWLPFSLAALGGAALIAVAFVSLRAYRDSEAATLDAAQTYSVEAVLFTNLLDAESGQRGYLLTGDEAALTRYTKDVASLRQNVDQLEQRTLGDAVESPFIQQLRADVDAKIAEMDKTIAQQRAGTHDAALATVTEGTGASLTESIRTSLVGIVREEAAQRNSAHDAAGRHALEAEVAIGLLAAGIAGLLGWTFFTIRRRGVEASLRRSNREKDEFLGMVSHELRTPITVVLGNARLLRRSADGLTAEERDQALRDMEDESERLQGLMENMLRLSRPESVPTPELEPVLLSHEVKRAVKRHGDRYPLPAVEVHIANDLPPVNGRPEWVQQILLNLLSNAAKYGSRTEPIEVRAQGGGGRVTVSVSDRGPGVKGKPDRVFQPFVRLPNEGQEGLGLGLPVCRKLIEVQGGEISAADRPGGGAVFTFWLPAVVEEAEITELPVYEAVS